MPRTTLKQQWDALKEELQRKETEYAKEVFGGKLPAEVFEVDLKGNIERWTVKRATLSHDQRVYLTGRSPKREDVAGLREYLAHFAEVRPAHVYLRLEIHKESCVESRSTSLDRIQREEWGFLDEAKAQAKAAEVKAKRQREKEMLANGGIRCRYCGEVREAKDIHYKAIISRMYRNLTSDPRPYCKDKGCAGYDQMGHEG